MSSTPPVRVPALLERIQRATNDHDVDALTGAFADDVDSRQPAHPERRFVGADQIRQNWVAIFTAVPDMTARLERWATDGETVWAEWDWSGNRRDGQPHRMRGVTIFGERDGRAAWVRLYMEPVVHADGGIDQAINELTATAGGPG
jgi:ketosteroid isomerase-like protein